MFKMHLLAGLLLLAGILPGQTVTADALRYGSPGLLNVTGTPGLLPVPASTSTYVGTRTRGYYFTVPVPIGVTGLQVPDSSSLGFQSVALYNLDRVPPAYSATMDATPVFHSRWQPSGSFIPVSPPVVFNPGDIFFVLGACSANSSTTLTNAYSPAAPTVALGSHTVTLYRGGMQYSIAANTGPGAGGVGPIYSLPSGSIAVVQVQLEIYPNPFPRLETTALPVLGQSATLRLTANMTPAPPGFAFLGRGRTAVPIGFAYVLIGQPWVFQVLIPPQPGTVSIPVPNNPVLMGAVVNWQAFLPALPGNLGASNGVEWTLGI